MLLKRFSVWLPIIYFILMLIGLIDETNIFIFLISPPFWVVETHWFVVNFMHPADIPLDIIILFTIVFWFLIGALIDMVILTLRKKLTKKDS